MNKQHGAPLCLPVRVHTVDGCVESTRSWNVQTTGCSTVSSGRGLKLCCQHRLHVHQRVCFQLYTIVMSTILPLPYTQHLVFDWWLCSIKRIFWINFGFMNINLSLWLFYMQASSVILQKNASITILICVANICMCGFNDLLGNVLSTQTLDTRYCDKRVAVLRSTGGSTWTIQGRDLFTQLPVFSRTNTRNRYYSQLLPDVKAKGQMKQLKTVNSWSYCPTKEAAIVSPWSFKAFPHLPNNCDFNGSEYSRCVLPHPLISVEFHQRWGHAPVNCI